MAVVKDGAGEGDYDEWPEMRGRAMKREGLAGRVETSARDNARERQTDSPMQNNSCV